MRRREHGKKTALIRAVLPVILVVILAIGSVTAYGWMYHMRTVAEQRYATGRLAPALTVMCWEKPVPPDPETGLGGIATGSWKPISKNGESGYVFPYLGEVINIAELPEDSNVYLKIKVNDASTAAYRYGVYVDDIVIKAYDDAGDEINVTVDYYAGEPSNKCFEYLFQTVATDNLDPQDPLALDFSGVPVRLAAPGQTFSGDAFVAGDAWLYVKLCPALTEMQNIFRAIPAENMPYDIEFSFDIRGESRTAE